MTLAAFANVRPQIRVAGEARDDLGEALAAMLVNLPLSGAAHAELQLSNWGVPEGGRAPDFVLAALSPGDAIDVSIAAGGDPVRLIEGEVTAIEERYGEGAPMLVLLLQDRLHRLARSRHSRAFEDMSPDQVLRSIAADAGLRADIDVSGVSGNWHQYNESDLAFALRLLTRFDVALRLEDGVLRARAEAPDPHPVQLDTQDSALRVRLIADLNHQHPSVRVRGYNAAVADDIDRSSDTMQPAPQGQSAAELIRELGWPGDEVVPQPFARSSGEAEAYAAGHFRRQARRFISGDIHCIGEPTLRSGREIELDGVSPRLRGTYQVVHCVHRFDNTTGFETHLRVQRADWERT
ncbi:phage late control D family protein [Halomonas sp. BM-2019]|uniref:phage late control D family protein n=1 Tax=Halomonas sp. BM-2019 TaxID=2811227 RepID=UPI001B3C3903|nr:MAG: phage late control D family protein [Halomonas sp. BM-2019]